LISIREKGAFFVILQPAKNLNLKDVILQPAKNPIFSFQIKKSKEEILWLIASG
jgi:hypothetical protein